jgi:hypothetical protein
VNPNPQRNSTVVVRREHSIWFLIALLMAPFAAGAWQYLHLGLPCLLRAWTGIPCPFCGGTRALNALRQGEFLGALFWNPLVVIGFVGGLGAAFYCVWRKETGFSIEFWRRAILWALALNWVYLVIFL